MRLYRNLLLAPSAADTETEREPDAIGSFMKALGELEGAGEATSPAQNKKEPDVKTTSTDTGSANAATATTAGAGGKGGTDNVPTKAADAKPAAAATKAADDTAEKDESFPRSGNDWDRFKAKRDKKYAAFEATIKEREADLAKRDARIAELEKASQNGGADAADKAQIEALTKERDALSERVQILDVTQHPQFQAHYNGRETAQIERAKLIVGTERAAAVEAALKIQDREYRESRLQDIIDELPPRHQVRLEMVIDEMEKIRLDKEADIKKANDLKNNITAKDKDKRQKALEGGIKLFEDTAKELSDEKNGFPAYQKKTGEGAEVWNKTVDERIGVAKRLLTGEGVKPGQIIRAVFDAAAMPAVLEAYKADMTEKNTEIESLKAQVAKLTAAQPSGGASQAAGDTGGNGDKKPEIKIGMSPQEALGNWMKIGPQE